MKTLHEVAEEICPYRLEDYDPAIDDILDECLHDSWIVGFIAGAQWREENPVAAGSVSDSIELGHRRLREGRPPLLHMG